MASLESELRQLRADLDVQRQACVRAEQNAAVLAAQKADLEARVAELKDAASAQSHANGASVEEHASSKADRSPRTSARRGEKAEGSGETSVPKPGHTSSSAPSGDAQPGDPRQSKLC
jgi:peptidoglycan hydrolase CwlO-like protein